MTACRGCMFQWPLLPSRAYDMFVREKLRDNKSLFAQGSEAFGMNTHLQCEAMPGKVHVPKGAFEWLVKNGATFGIVEEMRKQALLAPEAERADMYVAIDTVERLLAQED